MTPEEEKLYLEEQEHLNELEQSNNTNNKIKKK